jgi:hypothetical protein
VSTEKLKLPLESKFDFLQLAESEAIISRNTMV